MKITVYTLACDTDSGGTSTAAFATETDLKRALKDIIQTDIEADGTKKAEEVRTLLSTEDIDAAWEFWEDHIRPAEDTYSVGEHEIDIPDNLLPEPYNRTLAIWEGCEDLRKHWDHGNLSLAMGKIAYAMDSKDLAARAS
jgi:hypothetical protein